MAGNFKIIIVSTLLSLISCKQDKFEEKKRIGYEILNDNINILLDSLDYFDSSRILPPPKSKFKIIKDGPFNVEILNLIKINPVNINQCIMLTKNRFKKNKNKLYELSFKINRLRNIEKYKDYTIYLTKYQKSGEKTIKINFYNLLIDENYNYASLTVQKKVGIGMKEEIYYFIKITNKWKFLNKKLIRIG